MRRKLDLRFVIGLGVAEFFSALLVICALPDFGTLGVVLPGTLLGATLSLCLWFYGVVRSASKLLVITVASVVISVISVLSGIVLEFFSPLPFHTLGTPLPNYSNTTMFATGTIGAFLFLALVFIVVSSEQPVTKAVFRALCWSLTGGVLGVAGWNLRALLGPTLWSLRYDLNLTSPGDKLEYAVLQGRTGIASVMLVWQTGMGFLLGIALSNSLNEVRVTEDQIANS